MPVQNQGEDIITTETEGDDSLSLVDEGNLPNKVLDELNSELDNNPDLSNDNLQDTNDKPIITRYGRRIRRPKYLIEGNLQSRPIRKGKAYKSATVIVKKAYYERMESSYYTKLYENSPVHLFISRNQQNTVERKNQQLLMALKWEKTLMGLHSGSIGKHIKASFKENVIENFSPMALGAKLQASLEDNPTLHQARSDTDNWPMFWDAMKKEVKTLTKLDSWELVERQNNMNVLPGTWALKQKRRPDGTIKKYKERFCVRGDRQVEGKNFDQSAIYSPVCKWTTVRLMMVLSLLLKLTTKQIDYIAAFVQAPMTEDFFVEMPQMFREPVKVLKLKRSLYGCRKSPKNFFNFMKGKLENTGLKQQTSLDQCLFMSSKLIALVYVNDTIFYSLKMEYIDEVIKKLCNDGVTLEDEDDMAGFLGVKIT